MSATDIPASFAGLENTHVPVDGRLGEIADWQQTALALEKERKLNEALQSAYLALEKEFAEKCEAQQKLRESELSLRELSTHLLRTQDDERRRLGRELHDTIGQYLAALKMGLDAIRRTDGVKTAVAGRIQECVDLVEQSIKEIRTMSYLLYPPMLEEAGLETAIPWYLDGFGKRSGIQTTFNISVDFGRLSRQIELAIFRVLQESLTNVHRHSGSPTADVRLFLKDGAAQLEVRDKGQGIPDRVLQSLQGAPGPLGVGLRGMRERVGHLGGELRVDTGAHGTNLVVTIPLAKPVRVAVHS